MTARPFIKWAGGKTQLIPAILDLLPKHTNSYYEPFTGGGAVFFAMAAADRFERAVLNDWNKELIETYRVVRDFPEDLMKLLRDREEAYEQSPKTVFKAWQRPDPLLARELLHKPISRAARFIFLNKAGFNGLYRVNKAGEFNVPWGQKLKVVTHDPENIRACSDVLNRYVRLRTGDFADAVKDAEADDVVYFDPPYVPAGATSDFTSYTASGFTIDDQHRLAACFKELAARGVRCLLSNSDTEIVRSLYDGFDIVPIQARRAINSKGSARGPVGEVLVVGRRPPQTLTSLWPTAPEEAPAPV